MMQDDDRRWPNTFVKRYSLVSFSDERTHALVGLKVLTDDARELQTKVPGVYLTREATIEATDPETAYLALVCAMIVVPRSSPAAEFWHRVAAIPRIRVAALRRIGLRSLGPVMREPYLRGESRG